MFSILITACAFNLFGAAEQKLGRISGARHSWNLRPSEPGELTVQQMQRSASAAQSVTSTRRTQASTKPKPPSIAQHKHTRSLLRRPATSRTPGPFSAVLSPGPSSSPSSPQGLKSPYHGPASALTGLHPTATKPLPQTLPNRPSLRVFSLQSFACALTLFFFLPSRCHLA